MKTRVISPREDDFGRVLRDNSLVRVFESIIPDMEAIRLASLDYVCLRPACDLDIIHSVASLRLALAFGMKVNVLEYTGEDIASADSTVEKGNFLGYLEYKKTGFFSPTVLEDTLHRVQGGENVEWSSLVSLGFPKDFSDAVSLGLDPKDKPVCFLRLIDVLPSLRRYGLATKLLVDTFKGLKGEGIEYALAYARVPEFLGTVKANPKDPQTLREYLKIR